MVIRGLVRARLLGMQLLTLEARVVVQTDYDNRQVISPFILTPGESSGAAPASSRPGPVSSGSKSGFARATELLQQGADTLERIRQPGFR